MDRKMFASCGSCFLPVKEINGIVEGTLFISDCFCADICSSDFWEKLKEFSKKEKSFIELVY